MRADMRQKLAKVQAGASDMLIEWWRVLRLGSRDAIRRREPVLRSECRQYCGGDALPLRVTETARRP